MSDTTNMLKYKHVLFAMDYSEDAKLVGEKAKYVAKINGAKLTIIHVIEAPNITIGYELMPLSPNIADDEAQVQAKKNIADIAESLCMEDVNLMVLNAISTKEGIIYAAKDLNADLIVIGAHTRHGLSLLLGSTAKAILNDAPCDVLTIKLQHN